MFLAAIARDRDRSSTARLSSHPYDQFLV